jgi:large subunit ribosomal protein L32
MKKHTKAKCARGRSHMALKDASIAKCPKCGTPCYPHRVCKNCGFYKGKEFINVLAKLSKREQKKKKKELEHSHDEHKKTLDAKEMSKK